MKKMTIVGLSFLLPLCSLVLWKLGAAGREADFVATVNGAPIDRRQLMMMLPSFRSETIRYYYTLYGAAVDERFWRTRYGEQTPAERIKQASLEAAVRMKVEQQFARRLGVADGADYSTFLMRRQEENRRRQEAANNGQVLYGPVQYGEKGYFDSMHSNMAFILQSCRNKACLSDIWPQLSPRKQALAPCFHHADRPVLQSKETRGRQSRSGKTYLPAVERTRQSFVERI